MQTDEAGVIAEVVEGQTPLDRLLLREDIGFSEYDAGMRLRGLWSVFSVSGPVVSRYGREPSGVDWDRVVQAKDTVTSALRNVGEAHAAILLDVCVFDVAPTAHVRTLGMHPRKGVPSIVGALEALAREWGYR